MRSDRDEYITINWDNVIKWGKDQFRICKNCDLQGLPYDIHSIMHYGPYSWMIDNTIPTIIAKDGTPPEDLMGKNYFSDNDIEGINKIYCG